jgi:hypothetical protein
LKGKFSAWLEIQIHLLAEDDGSDDVYQRVRERAEEVLAGLAETLEEDRDIVKPIYTQVTDIRYQGEHEPRD